MQPGILFGVNDSGNEPILFALDTLGQGRGSWIVRGASNQDWEALAAGPCGAGTQTGWGGGALSKPADASGWGSLGNGRCIYIADVGDNASQRAQVTLYRVQEPTAMATTGLRGELRAERLHLRYPGLRLDVEALYVAGNGDAFLISKRQLLRADQSPRPALVFRVPMSAWGANGTAMSELLDSLPIFPGSAPGRMVTDASLSHDGARLAVRTYSEVFVFRTDSASGRLSPGALWWSCPVIQLGEQQGEGVAWWWDSTSLVLTSEGMNAPLHVIRCEEPSEPGSRNRE